MRFLFLIFSTSLLAVSGHYRRRRFALEPPPPPPPPGMPGFNGFPSFQPVFDGFGQFANQVHQIPQRIHDQLPPQIQNQVNEIPRRIQGILPQVPGMRPLAEGRLNPLAEGIDQIQQNGIPKAVENMVHDIGNQINLNFDLMHGSGTGIIPCNLNSGPSSVGVCTGLDCDARGGDVVGKGDQCLPLAPICCKFSRGCSGESSEAVTHFKRRVNATEEFCEMRIRSRSRACQLRVDFLNFTLPPMNSETGKCDPETGILEVINQGLNPESGLGKLTFCGNNSGNHFYLPITRKDEIISFKIKNRNNITMGPEFDWNIRIIQVDCDTRLPVMKAIRASPSANGCLQYHWANAGRVRNLNLSFPNAEGPVNYGLCFASGQKVCGLRLNVTKLNLSPECTDASSSNFLRIPNAENQNSDNFCQLDSGSVIVTRSKPFILRTVVNDIGQLADPSSGFEMNYELLPCQDEEEKDENESSGENEDAGGSGDEESSGESEDENETGSGDDDEDVEDESSGDQDSARILPLPSSIGLSHGGNNLTINLD